MPPHTARVGSALPGALGRLLALAGVGALGVAALVSTAGSAADGGQRPVAVAAHAARPAPAVVPNRQPVPATRHAQRPATRRAAEATVTRSTPARPAAKRPAQHAPRRPAQAKPARWMPSGTGMWIYQWGSTSGGSGTDVVARARRVGLSTLYLRTGSSHDGFSGKAALSELLHATRGTSLHVVAWDFPVLRHPVRDARRLARAARWDRHTGGPRVAAVAPDIETPAEGTFNAAWRVRTYMAALRRHLPADVTILGTVPWPSRYRIADYPYHAVAARSDALVPMAYWYNNPPALVTARSISYLKRFHKPVEPVGQGYDGKLDVPSLKHNHLGREVPRFIRVAHQHGARAVSLWSWQSAPRASWRALGRARHLFVAHH